MLPVLSRFYLLHDKIYREDLLAHAYELAKADQGVPGVAEQTLWRIEPQGLEKWLEGFWSGGLARRLWRGFTEYCGTR